MRKMHKNDYHDAKKLCQSPSHLIFISSPLVTSSHLESRSSTLLLFVHQMKCFQPKDNGENQDRKGPSPGPIGKMGAGSLEQSIVRGYTKNRLVFARDEASICPRDKLDRSAESIANEA